MGNFSQDPDKRAADAAKKHYVAVRLQQAVPVLDADWNLLEDLRRGEMETLASLFIGDGVPVGSDGFHILASTQPSPPPNDFVIRAGSCIVGGKLTINDADTSYATQPNFGNPNLVPPLAALTTPAADKTFIVYLDVFEEEVDSLRDPGLIDIRIGIETALRLKRNWAVRVARVPEDFPLPPAPPPAPPPGHLFLELAQLDRKAGNPAIDKTMIKDLRDTQLSIKRKIEVRDGAGNIVVTNARFQQMLQNTRNNLLALISYITSQFNPIFVPLLSGEILGLQAADHIARAADAGLALVNSSNFANPGALQYMTQLYDAQENFRKVWHDVVLMLMPGGIVKKYASYTTFVQRLDDRLNSPLPVGPLTPLRTALNTGDLAAAVAMQEEIARLFGTASGTIPRGAITVFLFNSSPQSNLTTGVPVRFEFHVRSATTLADTYTVNVLPPAPSDPPAQWPWTVVNAAGNPIPGNRVPIGAAPDEVPVFVNVMVQTGQSGLQLRVTSDANPDEITQTSNHFLLTEGQPPPLGEQKIQFSVALIVNGTKDPATGVIDVSRTKTCALQIQVFNNSGQDATFSMSIAKQNETQPGSWNADYQGDPSRLIPNAGFVREPLHMTPAANAGAVEIVFTAQATIQGLSGQFVIPFAAVS
jgi:hypothetical protein